MPRSSAAEPPVESGPRWSLPLDPALPEERLAYMIEDAQVAFLLTTESLASMAQGELVMVVSFCGSVRAALTPSWGGDLSPVCQRSVTPARRRHGHILDATGYLLPGRPAEFGLFYMGYGDYDVSLTMPAGWLVTATGELLQILRLRPALTAVASFEFALRERAARLAALVAETFPAGTRSSRATGSSATWVGAGEGVSCRRSRSDSGTPGPRLEPGAHGLPRARQSAEQEEGVLPPLPRQPLSTDGK